MLLLPLFHWFGAPIGSMTGVPPAYGPCEPESREGYTPGRGPPYARVVTLTLLLSCVSPCVAASPGRVLAGVRWGFSPCVFRSWLVLW